jgi:hypothetical protein
MQPDQEWMSEAELIASIKGEFVPNHKVLLGLAFGKILETPDAYRVRGGYICNGLAFGDDVMGPALAVIDRRGVFEAKAVKRYGAIDVVAKADHLLGAHLSEFKTTLSTFDFDKYAASCQWRFMVDLFESTVVTYHVFCLAEGSNGVIALKSVESFNLFPYEALHTDCEALLADFVEYVTRKGLDGYLDQRQREAA